MPELKKPTEREIRIATVAWPTVDVEIRASGDDGMTFTGYAAVFNSPSEDMGFRERIAPGAFTRSLKTKGSDIRMFMNHNTDHVLATTKAKTLVLAEDDKGLLATAKLPDTQAGRDLSTLMKRGDVDSMSFGFWPVRENWTDDAGKETAPWFGTQRELTEVNLLEVSPVTGWPAYTGTSAAVRSLADRIEADGDELDAALRVFVSEKGELTAEQHALIIRALQSRTAKELRFVGPDLAEMQARFAAKGLAL